MGRESPQTPNPAPTLEMMPVRTPQNGLGPPPGMNSSDGGGNGGGGDGKRPPHPATPEDVISRPLANGPVAATAANRLGGGGDGGLRENRSQAVPTPPPDRAAQKVNMTVINS